MILCFLMPSPMLEDLRWTLIHDTTKRCVQSLEAYPLDDVDDTAASHFALASDDLDDITNGLADLVAWQDLSLTGKRAALLDVKITIEASEWQNKNLSTPGECTWSSASPLKEHPAKTERNRGLRISHDLQAGRSCFYRQVS